MEDWEPLANDRAPLTKWPIVLQHTGLILTYAVALVVTFGLFRLVSNHAGAHPYICMGVSINIYLPTHLFIYLNYYEASALSILIWHIDKAISQIMFRSSKLSSINHVLGDEKNLHVKHIFPFQSFIQSVTIGSETLTFFPKGHPCLHFAREWGQDWVNAQVILYPFVLCSQRFNWLLTVQFIHLFPWKLIINRSNVAVITKSKSVLLICLKRYFPFLIPA